MSFMPSFISRFLTLIALSNVEVSAIRLHILRGKSEGHRGYYGCETFGALCRIFSLHLSFVLVIAGAPVEFSALMSPEDLRNKIRAAAVKFTEELIAVFGDAFANAAADFMSVSKPRTVARAVAGRRRVVQARKAISGPKGRKVASKRARRSGDELEKAGDGVVRLLSANKKGLRVEEINKALGTNTRELMRPIQKLLGEGKIRKSGERRATTYFVA
jgi:hypothetical protein